MPRVNRDQRALQDKTATTSEDKGVGWGGGGHTHVGERLIAGCPNTFDGIQGKTTGDLNLNVL
jgi:hypothetical protein